MQDQHIETARKVATKAHEGQARWGGEPFITHPEAVAVAVEHTWGRNTPQRRGCTTCRRTRR